MVALAALKHRAIALVAVTADIRVDIYLQKTSGSKACQL